jgi:excisionase family DNA binding protein
MPLLTTTEIAAYLNLHQRTVRRKLRTNAIPAVKVGGRWRFRREQIDEWLAQGCPTQERAPDLFSWAADRQGAAR